MELVNDCFYRLIRFFEPPASTGSRKRMNDTYGYGARISASNAERESLGEEEQRTVTDQIELTDAIFGFVVSQGEERTC